MRPVKTRKVVPVALSLMLGALLLLVGITLFQHRLLYFPARAGQQELVNERLHAWPSAQNFRALVAEPRPPGAARGTAIVFHGNAGHAGHRAFYADALTALGLRVILAEYPGYGPRDGAPGERALVEDAAQSIAIAHRLHGAPLIVIGESLGSGVAAAAAAREADKVAALWLITPWDRLAGVAAHHYPWLPVRWMLRDRFESAAHLAGFAPPVLVMVAGQDQVVPERFGIALYEGLPGPKRLLALPDASHNDWPSRVDTRWWAEALDFLLAARR
jgi:uncharacterized protein